MTTELKDCAFCNGPAVFVKHSAGMPGTMGWDAWHAVECKSCGATIGAYDRRFRDNDEAAKVWNLRTTPAQEAAAVQAAPVIAYATVNEEGDPAMLFFDKKEAMGYCNDDDEPIPLIARQLYAIGEGKDLNAGTPAGDEPCTVDGLREQLKRLDADLASSNFTTQEPS
jgi:hypothetical protein